MSETPYVRPSLTATRLGVTDAALLVDLWADQLTHAFALLESEGPVNYHAPTPTRGWGRDWVAPARAAAIIAAYGRMKRCRPEHLSVAGASSLARLQAPAPVAGAKIHNCVKSTRPGHPARASHHILEVAQSLVESDCLSGPILSDGPSSRLPERSRTGCSRMVGIAWL